MDYLYNLIFCSNITYTLSIPVWLVFVVISLPCWMLYWYKTNKLRINGKPSFTEITYDSFRVVWDKPICPFPVTSYYEVYLRKPDEPETDRCFRTNDDTCSMTIHDLQVNTEFVVKVRACTETDQGPRSDESNVIRTKNLAFKLRDDSNLRAETIPHSMPVHDVSYRIERNEQLKTRIVMIGEVPEEDTNQSCRRVLFLSIPHSGKTTLFQGIMNFIFGVSWKDDFRLGFTEEITNKSEGYQDWATVYTFCEYKGGKLGEPLSLIDIPMMQGPRKEQFKKIYEQLKYILKSNEWGIDSVCFVVPANYVSLSRDEFDFIQSIMYLFQTNSSTDMCFVLTFADAGPSLVKNILDSYENRCLEGYSFNWSALFKKDCELSHPFWNMNVKNLDLFFEQLKTSSPKTLRSSLEGDTPPPEKREELKTDIAALQPEVNDDLAKLEEINTTVDKFKNNRKQITDSGDFSFQIEEIKQTKKPLAPGKHVTNCMQCFFTCHVDCGIPDDDGKKRCSAMSDGYCTVCTGHCIWSDHKNTPHTYHYTSVKVTKSFKEMKSSYEREKGVTLEFDDYLEHLNRDIEALIERIQDKVRRITECKNELQGIQRSPLAGTFDDTINDMINAEMRKKEKGFERRIEMFQELKKHSKLIRIQEDCPAGTSLLFQR